MGSFLAKSTTRVMAGVMIFVNSLNASRSTLSPSGMEAMGDWPMSSGCGDRWWGWGVRCDLVCVSPCPGPPSWQGETEAELGAGQQPGEGAVCQRRGQGQGHPCRAQLSPSVTAHPLTLLGVTSSRTLGDIPNPRL